jgi:hypothetical protein
MWIGVGSLIGFSTAYVLDKNKSIKVTPSK